MSKKTLVCLSLLVFTFACSAKPAKVELSKSAETASVDSDSKSKTLLAQLQALSAASNGKMKVVQDKDSLNEIVLKCRGDDEGEEGSGNNNGKGNNGKGNNGNNGAGEVDDDGLPVEDGFPDDEANNGGDDGINNGGDDGINNGGDDGINNGGDDGINNGGDDGINNGGDDGINNGGDDGINNGGENGELPGIECDDGALAAAKAALLNLIKPLFVFLSEDQVQEIVDAISSAIPDTCEASLQSKVTAAVLTKDDAKSAILVDSSGKMKKVKVPSALVKKLLK